MSAFSKTDEFCDCGILEEAADNPYLPIEFNESLNEFHLVYNVNGGEGRFTFWHCPLCGGRAPESKRALMFKKLTVEERSRLVELTKHLKTLDEVISSLGKPDKDDAAGVMMELPETENTPPIDQSYRSLVYENLSDIANIHVTVYPNERVGISFVGKYIGDNNVLQSNDAG